MMRLVIELSIELDSALTIAEMKAEVVKDVKTWLATAPIMAKLAEAEDTLKVVNG
jgi:hypothetical protein